MSLEAKPPSAVCLGASEVISKKVILENRTLAQQGHLHFADAVQGRPLGRETQGQAIAKQRGGI